VTRSLLLSLLAVALAASSCGGSEQEAALDAESPSPSIGPPVQGPIPVGSKPEVTIPDGAPPTSLQVQDITVGTGAEAVSGATVTVHYVGVVWSTKEQFDASWDSGEPIVFPLGQGRVIPGWEQGILGMKVGGRRELIIPPDQAYGPSGRPPLIGPNETLVFVVDLLAVG
jgi:peptidylprolyl isomerase